MLGCQIPISIPHCHPMATSAKLAESHNITQHPLLESHSLSEELGGIVRLQATSALACGGPYA